MRSQSRTGRKFFWNGVGSIVDLYGITIEPVKVKTGVEGLLQDQKNIAGDWWKAINKVEEKYGRKLEKTSRNKSGQPAE